MQVLNVHVVRARNLGGKTSAANAVNPKVGVLPFAAAGAAHSSSSSS